MTAVINEGAPLVVAMTRPTMLGGFTLSSIALSLYVPAMMAMIVHAIWPLITVPCLLLVSYLVCLKDVYLFQIAAASMHLKSCPNKRVRGYRTYAPR